MPKPKQAPHPVYPRVQVQDFVIERRAYPIEQPIELGQAIKLMSVNHQVVPAVGRGVHHALHQPDASKSNPKKLLEKFIVIAADECHLRVLSILPQQLLDQHIIFIGPIPLAPQLPAIYEIAHNVQVVAVGVPQEFEKLANLRMPRPKVDIRNPDCPIVRYFVHPPQDRR